MPKTVVENSGSASNNRFNPYISKGISKTLLTPCRQVGLSRKRRTPNSIKNLDNEDTKTPEVNTTSITSKNSLNDDSIQKVNINSELIKANRNKSSVAKCLIASDNDVTSLEVTSLSDNGINFGSDKSINHVMTNIKDKEKNLNKKNASHLTEQSCEGQSHSDKVKHYIAKENLEALKKKKSQLSHEKFSIQEYSTSQEIITALQENKSEYIKDNFILKEINSGKCSTKIDLTLNDTPKLGTVSKEETIVKSKKSSENSTAYEKPIFDPTKVDHNYIQPEKKSKLKRSLSMKKSNEELRIKNVSQTNMSVTEKCSMYLNSLNFNSVKKDTLEITPDEIKKLEKQVQEKKRLLEDMKRAQIYKKLHDVNELKYLTSTWKTGCISALNDLLPNLQAHGDIDMATLLKKLGVPEKLIKLSENGDLI